MARRGTLGRIIVLVLLIVVLIFGGLLWFDYLGIVRSRHIFSPLYSLLGRGDERSESTLPSQPADVRAKSLELRA